MREVYLDNASTTKVFPEVADVVSECLEGDAYGNPFSLHRKGIQAEKIVKKAREIIAGTIKAGPDEIIFTSGGTEANNLAISGAVRAYKRRGNRIITTEIEHPSVLNVFKVLESEGFEVVYLKVDRDGVVNPDDVLEAVNDNTILVSIMHVNNETGSIQPIRQIGSIKEKKKTGFVFHVDAVQSYMKLPVAVRDIGADLISISGHKIHSMKGTGALYIRKGQSLTPLYYGGGQERGVRPGTENVSGIAAFGKAVETVLNGRYGRYNDVRLIKDRFAEMVLEQVPGACINGPLPENAGPHIVNISFLGVKAEVLLHVLEANGVYVSAGSACSARDGNLSHVLVALGLEKGIVEGAVRFSFSLLNSMDDVDYCVKVLKNNVGDLRKYSRR